MGIKEVILYIIFFIAGLAVGSFLGVVVYRLPRKLSIVRPPSFCPECNKKIPFYDNIPLLSYIILKGR
ncbi:MAG: prepilin peptidase, partial [Actinomycetota bacterium]|nr:prepilin peptidase [Actinomycetota bacterium]